MALERIELSDSCFDEYIKVVHQITGITLDKNRKVMLVGRIRKRVDELSLKSYEEYLDYLKSHREEEQIFTNLVTTNETYCFRTPRIWDFLSDDFLKNWDSLKKLHIWSAASSSGEEAYTAGIFCHDHKQKNPGFSYKILGTDISSKVVEKAQKGIYVGRPVRRFQDAKEDLFKKYMIGDDHKGFEVLPEIKSNISFETHNLFKSLRGAQKFDIIFLRNVLIYFTKPDQEKVIKLIHDRLTPNGYLIIGESESLARIQTDFESVSPLIYQSRFCVQKKVA